MRLNPPSFRAVNFTLFFIDYDDQRFLVVDSLIPRSGKLNAYNSLAEDMRRNEEKTSPSYPTFQKTTSMKLRRTSILRQLPVRLPRK